MSSSRKKANQKRQLAIVLVSLGGFLIVCSLVLFYLVFGQVLREELKYDLHQVTQAKQSTTEITPVSTRFGIVIPKIGANAPVVENVDPYNEKDYQVALTKGIAHAQGTSLPEHANKGSIFLFAHSAANFYEANRYNAVFYLLNKLRKNDEIILFYQEKKFVYYVTETKIVNEDDLQYLSGTANAEQLILMTCWPAGTSLKRFLVFAEAR